MNITSADEALLELFEMGKTSSKKYRRLPMAAIKGYVKAVNKMRAATRIEDIMRDRGLRYERLRGDRKGEESVRCNDVWRLIFRSYPENESIVITEIELLEISYHYD
jgi:proteic killer suppression protein